MKSCSLNSSGRLLESVSNDRSRWMVIRSQERQNPAYRATLLYYNLPMPTKPEFVEKILEHLEPLNVTAKPMFGEYGLYLKGKLFGLICDDTLFIKVTDEGSKIAGKIGKDSPYPGAKPAFKISAARLSDEVWLKQLVETTTKSLPAPKPKKKSGL